MSGSTSCSHAYPEVRAAQIKAYASRGQTTGRGANNSPHAADQHLPPPPPHTHTVSCVSSHAPGWYWEFCHWPPFQWHFPVSTGFINLTTMKLISDSVQFSSVTQSCPTLCDTMNCSTPGLPVHHQLPEFTQTHVHRVGDAIQPSHPLSSPSPPAPSPSQHQSLVQWVNSSHEVIIHWLTMSQKCLYQVFPKLSLMVSLVEITPVSFILSAASGIYRVPASYMVHIASRMSQFRGTNPGSSVRRWTSSLSSKCLQSSGDRQAL